MARNLDELREVNNRIIEEELHLRKLVDEATKPEIFMAILRAEADIDQLAVAHVVAGSEVSRMMLVKSCYWYWYIISQTLSMAEEELGKGD